MAENSEAPEQMLLRHKKERKELQGILHSLSQ